ncbi:MAG: MFS transporter [Thermomicrobiales bacterium]|nr:MFS transporter [Thermomicrobiales bacterium]
MSAGPFEPPSYPHLAEESELFLTPPPPRQEARATFTSMLRGGFLRLWIAQALSQTANNVVNFALLLLVTQIIETHGVTQANTAISLVILAFSLPAVLFGPLAGVMADRWDRRLMMASMNALRAISVISFLILNPQWHVGWILAGVYTLTFIFGIAGQFFAPALGASIPDLVPRNQLIQANALFNLTFTAAQLAGFATIGPLLAKVLGLDRLFELAAVVFVVCTVLVLTIQQKPKAEQDGVTGSEASRKVLADVKEGLRYILDDPYLIKAIAYLTIAQSTFLMVAALGPTFITTRIGMPKEDIGYLVAPAGLGVFAGVLLVPMAARRFDRSLLIDTALTAAGLMLLCLAISPSVLDWLWPDGAAPNSAKTIVAAFFASLLGMANAFVLVPSQTLLQERSHERIRARVYATFFAISNSVAFAPIFFAAASADLFGVTEVLTAIALLVILIGVGGSLSRTVEERARWNRPRMLHREGPEAIQAVKPKPPKRLRG